MEFLLVFGWVEEEHDFRPIPLDTGTPYGYLFLK